MGQNILPSHVGRLLAVAAQKGGGEVQTDHAARVADHRQLAIGQVARGWRDGMGVGMGGNKRAVRQPGHIVKALFVDVAEVDHDPQRVALADQPLAGRGQPLAGVGAGGEGKRHAVAEDRRPRPDRTDRAQTHGMEGVQRVEILADGLGPFHVQDARYDPACEAVADLGDGPDEAELPARGTFHPQHMPRHRHRHRQGLTVADKIGQGQTVGRVFHQLVVVDPVDVMRRGDVDRKEAAGKAALLHPGQVEMALAFPGQPDRLAVLRGVVKPQQDVVVAVESGVHAVSFVRRCAGVSHPQDSMVLEPLSPPRGVFLKVQSEISSPPASGQPRL